MAQSLETNFKIYQEYFDTGFVETLTQDTDAFNAATGGAISLVSIARKGDYVYDSFFKSISGLVSRRDITSTGAATDALLTQDEIITVKLNRKIGPVAVSLDAMKKKGRSPEEVSFIIGQQAAKAVQVDYLNEALLACRAALVGQTALLQDSGAAANIVTNDLMKGLAKRGDAAGDVIAWVMHSKTYFDLVQSQITAALYQANGVRVLEGIPVTAGRPVIVTDSPSLKVTNGISTGVDAYYTLGLCRGAVVAEESEPATVVSQLVTGVENMFYRVQGEHAYNLGLKGFKWDVTNGGLNPNDTAVGLGTNWDMAVSDIKLLGGVVIKSK